MEEGRKVSLDRLRPEGWRDFEWPPQDGQMAKTIIFANQKAARARIRHWPPAPTLLTPRSGSNSSNERQEEKERPLGPGKMADEMTRHNVFIRLEAV